MFKGETKVAIVLFRLSFRVYITLFYAVTICFKNFFIVVVVTIAIINIITIIVNGRGNANPGVMFVYVLFIVLFLLFIRQISVTEELSITYITCIMENSTFTFAKLGQDIILLLLLSLLLVLLLLLLLLLLLFTYKLVAGG